MAFNAVDFVADRTGYWTNEIRIALSKLFDPKNPLPEAHWEASTCPEGLQDMKVIKLLLTGMTGFAASEKYNDKGEVESITLTVDAKFDPLAALTEKKEQEAITLQAKIDAEKASQLEAWVAKAQAQAQELAKQESMTRGIIETVLIEKGLIPDPNKLVEPPSEDPAPAEPIEAPTEKLP